MPRKKRDFSKRVLPDPKFNETIVTKTVNAICRQGKKSVCERAFYEALSTVEGKLNANAMEIFKKAIANVRPVVEVRSRRVGGATYQVPTEVRPERQDSLAIRWIAEAADERGERELAGRLASEIMDASQGKGGAMKRREETHRMAEANKAFAHFRW